jgi:4-carboxymuconolactone decarboxylase
MTRLKPLSRDALTPAQREAFERISRTRKLREDGYFGGPFDAWMRSPEVARLAMRFGNFVWERTVLGRRLVEFAICVTAVCWRSNVEWAGHSKRAMEHGVSEATLGDVLAGRLPEGAPEDERLVYEMSRAMHDTHRLPDDLYRRGVDAFGEQGVVDLMATIGYYAFVAMTLSAFKIQPSAGMATPFES